jgi:hypothetical protein
MKTRILSKIYGPVLLLTAALALSSCIIVDRGGHHRRHWEAPAPYSQGVRP